MGLFQSTILKKYLKGIEDKISVPYQQYTAYFHNPEIQENIRNSKEEQFQEGFLRELFVKILGYTLNPEPNFNLITEKKNEAGSKKADGAILVNGEVVGVIELKDGKTTDLKQVEPQAFGYKNYHRKASYVVISNFEKLRFYIDNAIDYIEFNLFSLSKVDFAVLWLCLNYQNIASNLPKQIKTESVSSEDQVTKQLYKEYSTFKRVLFEDLTNLNPNYDRLTLFKKSQKLLDRLLFILFAEDCGLLPPNSIVEIVRQWESLKEMDAYSPLYERLKKYFGYMNTGFKGKKHDIFAYNGGLFKPDEVLDNIQISDEAIHSHLLGISRYDFSSEVDVNILGHIFENSLTEIEEITNAITTNTEPKATSKRKKDGVFYTPRYITTYIVENTLGKLCTDKKAELEIDEAEYFADKKRQIATKKKLDEKLKTYRLWLLGLTICDPACGSGAFLNAALDFLIAEHKLIDEMSTKLLGGSIVFSDIENAILENNLYGVDINEESVEIAKLALWLRTAKPNRKLNSLNENIKCGNSLISDPEVAGDKAFDWQKEFPQVFEKGGFDVVIGNPPYGALITLKDKNYIKANYKTVFSNYDTYGLFFEKAINILKVEGKLGFITPNTFLVVENGIELRKFLFRNVQLDSLLETYNVFPDAIVEPIITIITKQTPKEGHIFYSILLPKRLGVNSLDFTNSKLIKFPLSSLHEREDLIFNYKSTEINRKIASSLFSKSIELKDIAKISAGVKPYEKGKGNPAQTEIIMSEKPFTGFIKKSEEWLRLIRGTQVNRYLLNWEGEYILYGENLAAPRTKEIFSDSKIVIRRTDDKILAVLDKEGIIGLNSVHCLQLKSGLKIRLEYLLAILNSRLLNWFFQYQNFHMVGKPLAEVKVVYIERLPIKNIPLSNQQPFIEKADQMLTLNADLLTKRQRFLKRLSDNFDGLKINTALERFDELDFKQFVAELKKQKINLSLVQQDEWEEYFGSYKTECNVLSAQIAETDKTIDQMVYELYGLTEEEIKIVENR